MKETGIALIVINMNRALRKIKILPALAAALLFANSSSAADSVSGLYYRAVTRGNPGEYEKFEKLPLEQIGVRTISSSLYTLKWKVDNPNPEQEKKLKDFEGERGKNNGQFKVVYERFLEHVKKAAQKGDPTAKIALYVFFNSGKEAPEDIRRLVSAEEIKRLADGGNQDAVYYYSQFELKDEKSKYEYLKESADENKTESLGALRYLARR